jgi:hypothetical protein
MRRLFVPPAGALALAALTACTAEPAGKEVVLSGDIPGLDSMASRGDSLIARTERGDVLGDPAPAKPVVDTAAPAKPVVEPPAAGPPPAQRVPEAEATRMMARARARADSMTRSPSAGQRTVTIPGDTVRGTLVPAQEGGGTKVALRADGRLIQLSGVGTTGLTALNGTEVMLRGVRVTPRDLVVTAYLVRGWNGLPAVDGTILPDGSLRATDGSGIIRGVVPQLLRSRTGARVWIALRGGQPVQFDLIER